MANPVAGAKRQPHLPIWRDAERFVVWAEQAVARFPRYHKYAVGADIRAQARRLCRLILRAQGLEAGRRLETVTELHLAAEELKLLLQVGKEVQAFRSWAELEQGVALALAIAKQAAGWRRALRQAVSVPLATELAS